jgi:hypothetical protein
MYEPAYTERATLALSAHERATDSYNPAGKATTHLLADLDWYVRHIERRMDGTGGDPYAGRRIAAIGLELERRGY